MPTKQIGIFRCFFHADRISRVADYLFYNDITMRALLQHCAYLDAERLSGIILTRLLTLITTSLFGLRDWENFKTP